MVTGVVWQALVYLPPESPLNTPEQIAGAIAAELPSESRLPTRPSCRPITQLLVASTQPQPEADAQVLDRNSHSDGIPQPLSQLLYLDSRRRYRILQPLELLTLAPDAKIFSTHVHDTRPLEGWVDETLPPACLPYEELAANPLIPTLHRAWQTDEIQILLIEDRSQWTLLEDAIGTATEEWEILSWLRQSLDLWQSLDRVGCRRSILIPSNWYLNEEQAIALGRLHRDGGTQQPQLADLAGLWQPILANMSISTDLEALLEEWSSQHLGDPEALCQRLEGLLAEDCQTTAIFEVDGDDEDIPTQILAPTPKIAIEAAARTDVGQHRKRNEDFYVIQTQYIEQQTPTETTKQMRGLYVVCDGMGGHAGGDVASATAVQEIQRYFQNSRQAEFPDEALIHEAIMLTNEKLFALNQEQESVGLGRMGTTLVMALVHNHRVAIAHVGDSRLYRIAKSTGLEQLSIDHEVGQREISQGIDPQVAYSRPDAYQLTQALGPRDNSMVDPDIQFLDIEEDTVLLLCSDGLSDRHLPEIHGQTHLLPLLDRDTDLESAVADLIALANEYNGHDNITVVLVRLRVGSLA